MHATLPLLANTDFPSLRRGRLQALQVNLGYRCNQACLHCHVNAGPSRKEMMQEADVEAVLQCLRSSDISCLDLTGGAPELHPQFRYIVESAIDAGARVIDRCNLTVLEEPGQEDTAGFLAHNRVEIVASLPCYLKENVEAQRGDGVFDASIRGLVRLNELGYGQPGSGLVINLMYNPQGPSLPPPQEALEQDYKRHLRERYGVLFNGLYTLANMPIQRFGSTLVSRGEFNDYMRLLKGAHQQANLPGVMCRSLVSVDWQGWVYDCDFNQMLDLPLQAGERTRLHVSELASVAVEGLPIQVAEHCYGCTAGQGSSCGGALD